MMKCGQYENESTTNLFAFSHITILPPGLLNSDIPEKHKACHTEKQCIPCHLSYCIQSQSVILIFKAYHLTIFSNLSPQINLCQESRHPTSKFSTLTYCEGHGSTSLLSLMHLSAKKTQVVKRTLRLLHNAHAKHINAHRHILKCS